MNDPIREIRELKNKAKNRRDQENYSRAEKFINTAIAIAEKKLTESTSKEAQCQYAFELADCHGILGGIHRRWGLESDSADQPNNESLEHLRESIVDYDNGYQYEANKDYAIKDSYNLVNRLIARILYKPEILSEEISLDDSDAILNIDIIKELQTAREILLEQIKVDRRGDYWALADTALIEILLDTEEPESAYAGFLAQNPPYFAYESVLSTLYPLSRLDFHDGHKHIISKISRAVEYLDKRYQN